jgi:hypothetical protein
MKRIIYVGKAGPRFGVTITQALAALRRAAL